MRIDLFKPWITEAETDAVAEVMRSGWLGMGPKVEEFERLFSEYVEASHAVALSSGTAALQLALEVLGIGPGDKVIVPAMTFVSTAHAVCHVGATPIFADVCADTLCIDWDDAERKMPADGLRAVIGVNFGGRLCDEPPFWMNDIPFIEDCAHACGTAEAGTRGDLACWSFHAVKNLTTGDGGMLTTYNEDWAEHARRLRWLGIDKSTHDRSAGAYSWDYDVPEIGYKCHMNDIAAAMGIVQLERLSFMNAVRWRIAHQYTNELNECERIAFINPLKPEEQQSRHLFQILANDRDGLMQHLADRGIATGVHYRPIHRYRCYGEGASKRPVAESVFPHLLSLPMHPQLTADDVSEVTTAIKEFYS